MAMFKQSPTAVLKALNVGESVLIELDNCDTFDTGMRSITSITNRLKISVNQTAYKAVSFKTDEVVRIIKIERTI